MKKVGLVLEGGAFRGLFTAGVLNYLAEKKQVFTYIVGVSSGAVNAVGYLSGQTAQLHRIISETSTDPLFGMSSAEHMGDPVNALFALANEKAPFDIGRFLSSDTRCEFTVTDCLTGEARFIAPGPTAEDAVTACRAACAIPMLSEPVKLGDGLYLDGGISDAVPVRHALENCDKVIVVLTRRENEEPTDYAKMAFLIDICYREKYPQLADVLLNRTKNYKRDKKILAQAEKHGQAWVIRPDLPSIRHFESDRKKTNAFYLHGYEKMKEQYVNLLEWLEGGS